MPLQFSQKNVKVSVERLLEREVDQIGRNGEETYIKPFSLSEELSYFASKIDFHGTHENVPKEDESQKNNPIGVGEKKQAEQPEGESNKETKWPWESVHSKLRIALSEVCVMLDVLECLHRKKYLVLDPIHQNTEPNKQTVKMLGCRKCLAQVGALIKKGAKSLTSLSRKNNLNDVLITDDEKVDEYYMQLMHLRQYWRVKKTGLQITGDVTYRSVGSHFWHPGLLEVKAAHKSDSILDQRKLIVNISPDLMQLSRLTVEIIDSYKEAPWIASTDLIPWKRSNTFDWENNLQLAQLHLFNLEIFSILSNDAFQGSYNNIEVLDSRICCRILEGVDVYVSHHVGEFNTNETSLNRDISGNDLTLLLSNLLLQHHSKNIIPCSLYPATSIHQHKPMRSSSFHNVLNRSFVPKECMLNSFLEKAKHKIWVQRLSSFLDYKAKTVRNSILIPHWNSIKYKLMSAVTVLIVTRSYVVTIKSSISVTIVDGHFKLALANGEKLTIPCDIGMLQELFDLELQNHMIRIANSLCSEHGWSVIQTSPKYSAVSGSNKTSVVNGSIFYSQIHQKSIKLFVYSVDSVEIRISEHMENPLTFLDEKFKLLDIKYTVLLYTNFPGRTFTEKIESLFLCL